MDIDGILEAITDYAAASRCVATAQSHREAQYQHHLKGLAQDRVDELITAVIDARVRVDMQEIIARLSASGYELPEI